MRTVSVFAAIAFLALPEPGAAQDPTQRADSLERELRRLHARLDSLERVVRQLAGQGRDTTTATDELAALRAAAAAAAPRADTTGGGPSSEQTQFVDRSRNLNRLNPEISVTGDVRFHGTREEPLEDNVEIREFEFSFQSALDPFSSTKIFAAFEEGALDIEEAYAYWTGLPGSLRVDVGRLRQQIGELNRWHLHALPESEYPLVLQRFLGEEGLVGDGLGLYLVLPAGGGAWGTHELWGQVALANNEILFGEGRRLSYLGHLNNFWQVSRSTFMQVGGTALYGENPEQDLKTRVFGVDVRLSWRPPERALYRSFTVRGEGYALTRDVAGLPQTWYGGYASAQYQLSRRLFAGARYDYVESFDFPGMHQWAFVPSLTWWQSEWVYLRAEWQRTALPVIAGVVDHSDRLIFQAVWAIGPHKHELF